MNARRSRARYKAAQFSEPFAGGESGSGIRKQSRRKMKETLSTRDPVGSEIDECLK